MPAARAAWKAHQPPLEGTTRVGLEATGARTPMPRARGRAPQGARGLAAGPHGPWPTTPCSAGWRGGASTAPLVLDGPMDGEAVRTSGKKCRCPTRRPGAVGIAENRPRHPVAGVQAAIAAPGARVRDLPPDAPALHPLATLCATRKARRKQAAHRRLEARWNDSGTRRDACSPAECAHDCKAAGYDA